jgi:transcriptional regulator with AAA-type ATPase domain
MSGTVLDDSMDGSYVRSDSNGDAAKGEFTAVKISPDVAGYSPAQIETTPEVVPAEQTEEQAEEQAQPEAESYVGSDAQPAVQTKSRSFKDVRELAKGIDPNIMPRHAPL